jgi:hypothetical protein
MNNPNPFYGGGPVAVPHDDFDYDGFIDHVFDALTVRETEIRLWFEAKSFVGVKIRLLHQKGPDRWECLMLRVPSQECKTTLEVQALVAQLADDLGFQFLPDEFCAVVWSDRICAHFRLMPQPTQP